MYVTVWIYDIRAQQLEKRVWSGEANKRKKTWNRVLRGKHVRGDWNISTISTTLDCYAMLLTVHVCARLSSEQISLWKTFSKLQKAFSNTAWSRSVLLCVESARTHRLRDRFHSRRDIISHCTIPHIFPSSSMHFFSLLIFGQHDNDDMKFVCVCALWPHISLSFFFYHPQLSRADDDLVLSAA